jgi:transposase
MAHIVEHLSIEELELGYRRSADACSARHYHAIWLLAQGHTVEEVSELTSFVPRWIEELQARYNAFGPKSLGDLRRHNGSKPKILTAEVLKKLALRLREPPADGGVWTSSKVAAFLAAELGLEAVAPQRGWEALRAIGWSIQTARPKNPNSATPEEAEAFKKTFPMRLPKKRRNIPTNPLKSGRRTNIAWA